MKFNRRLEHDENGYLETYLIIGLHIIVIEDYVAPQLTGHNNLWGQIFNLCVTVFNNKKRAQDNVLFDPLYTDSLSEIRVRSNYVMVSRYIHHTVFRGI